MSGMKECSWMLQPQEKSQNRGINHLGWKRAPRSSSPAFKLRSSKVRASVVNEEKHLNCKMIFPRHRGFLVTEPLAGEENEHVSLFQSTEPLQHQAGELQRGGHGMVLENVLMYGAHHLPKGNR